MKANKVRTLFVLSDLRIGGIKVAILNLLRNLDKNRFEVVLFLLERRLELLPEIPADVTVVYAGESIKYMKFLFPYYLAKLLPYARKADVIVGARDHSSTYLAYIAGLLTSKPVIGWVHVILDDSVKDESIGKRISKFVYPKLESIACVSQAVAESVRRVAEIKGEQIEVLYNLFDLDLIVNKGNEPCLKWYSDMIIEKPTLITVARLAYPKGLDFLIKAHKEVLRGGIDHNLVICGEGYLREKLEKLVESLGVDNSVFLPGYIANPFPLIKSATAFVMSSLHEGLGGVIIEALALGAPIVATDCGGIGEILCYSEYGIVVRPGDVSSLAEGMRKILLDGDLQKKLSEKGINRAKFFSLAKRTCYWQDLLLKIAK